MEKEKYLISSVPKTIERLQWKSQLIAFKCPWEEKGAIGIFEHMCPHSIQVCTGVKLSVLYTIWDGNSVSRLFLEGKKNQRWVQRLQIKIFTAIFIAVKN